MTLEEAIKHCEEKACGNTECAKEHEQLAEWLKELMKLRSFLSTLENKPTRQRLAEWSKTPEGRESYEKVAQEMRKQIAEDEVLENEISKSIENLEGCSTKIDGNPEYHLISDEDLRKFARHFARWGAEHATRAETPTDLEEAAEEESLWAFPEPTAQGYAKRLFFKSGFNRGAKWDREQMMKDALHGWLDEDNEPPYDLNVLCEEKIPFGKFKHCDKVRIIIVKEDEK